MPSHTVYPSMEGSADRAFFMAAFCLSSSFLRRPLLHCGRSAPKPSLSTASTQSWMVRASQSENSANCKAGIPCNTNNTMEIRYASSISTSPLRRSFPSDMSLSTSERNICFRIMAASSRMDEEQARIDQTEFDLSDRVCEAVRSFQGLSRRSGSMPSACGARRMSCVSGLQR